MPYLKFNVDGKTETQFIYHVSCHYCGGNIEIVYIDYVFKSKLNLMGECNSSDHVFEIYKLNTKHLTKDQLTLVGNNSVIIYTVFYIDCNDLKIRIVDGNSFTKIDIISKKYMSIDYINYFEQTDETIYIGEKLNICKEKISNIINNIHML